MRNTAAFRTLIQRCALLLTVGWFSMVAGPALATELVADSGHAAVARNKLDSKDFKGAIEAYSRAIKLDPKSAVLYRGRAVARLMLDLNAAALKDCSEAIRLDPQNSEAFYYRGLAKRALKQDKSAISDFSSAMKNAPGDFATQLRSLSGRAGAKSEMGDYPGAIADYDAVLKLDASEAGTYYLRGVNKLQAGDKRGALADLSKAGSMGHMDAYDAIKQINTVSP